MTATAAVRGEPATSSLYAYEALAYAISVGRLAPGTPLRERADAARLGMSRTPFREALQRLEQDGLVVRHPKRGAHVAPLVARDVAEFGALREAVEVAMALRLIAEPGVDLRPLDAMLSGQKAAVEAGDWTAFVGEDERFHLLLVELAGNRRALETARRAWLHVNRARYLVPLAATELRAALADHREILRALREGDADGVRWAVRRHVGQPAARLLAQLRDRHPEAFADEGWRSSG
jgi:DNA-binding GntR family transcriptional regulator